MLQSNYEYDHERGLMTRRDTQNVDALIKQNLEERNSGVNTDRKSNARKVASIPVVEVERLKTRSMADGGPIDLNLLGHDSEMAARFVRYLNDPDNRAFRTSDVRV